VVAVYSPVHIAAIAVGVKWLQLASLQLPNLDYNKNVRFSYLTKTGND